MIVQESQRRLIVGHANTMHDPAIAFVSGNEMFAEGIERHTQCKRALEISNLWYSWRSIKDALSRLDILPLEEAEIVNVTSWDPELLEAELSRTGAVENGVCRNPNFSPLGVTQWHHLGLEPLFVNQVLWVSLGHPPSLSYPETNSPWIQRPGVSWLTKNMNHHLAHAATAALTSPFEECVVMVIDGQGEVASSSFYHFVDNDFKLLHTNDHLNSLGALYSLVTLLCGFNVWEGEEWKVMGLAAYGEERPEIYNFFKELVSVAGLDVKFRLSGPAIEQLEQTLGGFRRHDDPDVMKAADLAHNFQKWFEDSVVELARGAADLGLSRNLAYGGGCALNSSANGKILSHTSFENLFVPSAPGDDGNCLGAALYEKHCVLGMERSKQISSPYLGSLVDLDRLESILDFEKTEFEKCDDDASLCSKVADLLVEGKIIGWMQGRAEFGPRALGNRSILCDPRPKGMKDLINQRVKFREHYRPLAPSILHEWGNLYFEAYQESPYMERTLVFRPEVRDKVPTVIHRDGTGRLQTVKKEWNPLYYRLIRSFYDKTGIPLIVNTSFNVMGKPIIHSVEDALTVFYTTGLDHVVIGRYILSK